MLNYYFKLLFLLSMHYNVEEQEAETLCYAGCRSNSIPRSGLPVRLSGLSACIF